MASARLTVHPAGYLYVSTQTGLQSLPSRAGSGLPIKPCSFKMLKPVCARTSAAGTTLWKPLFISVSLEAMKVCLSVVADSYNITLGRSPFCRLKAPGRERAPWGGKSGSWDNLGKVKSCLKGTACGNGHDLWMEEGALGWNGCDPWLLGVRTHMVVTLVMTLRSYYTGLCCCFSPSLFHWRLFQGSSNLLSTSRSAAWKNSLSTHLWILFCFCKGTWCSPTFVGCLSYGYCWPLSFIVCIHSNAC